MRFSTFTDYSLRVLIYLGLHQDRLSTIGEIAEGYAISENHLMKVVHQLGRNGYVETYRGKGGGMKLSRQPQDIVLGELIRLTEGDFDLVECFQPASRCRIQPACALKGILEQSLEGMFQVLDAYTLADLMHKPRSLERAISGKVPPGREAIRP